MGVLGALVFLRLIDIQLLQHHHYATLASNEHQSKYELPASRGEVYLQDNGVKVPLALNQTLKMLYADPSQVTDKKKTAEALAQITGDNAQSYLDALNKGHEYAVLKTKLTVDMGRRVKALGLRGIGLKDEDYRVYPEGQLASQTLGFVNSDGVGQYGLEGYLNDELKGKPGELNAKTDTAGVPIATAANATKQPIDGTSVVLTLDRNIQAQAEKYLEAGVKTARAVSGSIVITDPKTGAVKAMANYPSFDPNLYTRVTDYHTFENGVVDNQFEPGSGFKVFTVAAGEDTGKVTPDTTYNDTGSVLISGQKIGNAGGHTDGPDTTITKVLRDSLNTGVVYVLKLLGGDQNRSRQRVSKYCITTLPLTLGLACVLASSRQGRSRDT